VHAWRFTFTIPFLPHLPFTFGGSSQTLTGVSSGPHNVAEQ
jgi:hypothetical protein